MIHKKVYFLYHFQLSSKFSGTRKFSFSVCRILSLKLLDSISRMNAKYKHFSPKTRQVYQHRVQARKMLICWSFLKTFFFSQTNSNHSACYWHFDNVRTVAAKKASFKGRREKLIKFTPSPKFVLRSEFFSWHWYPLTKKQTYRFNIKFKFSWKLFFSPSIVRCIDACFPNSLEHWHHRYKIFSKSNSC